MARHGRDIGELLDHLGLDDVTLVGASMGGNAIWAYVDQFGSGRLRGVVIIDQTPKMLNTPDWPYGFYGYNVANAGILFAEGVPPTGAAGRQRSQGRGWPGWRSGWAGRRYSVTRPPRRRSGCCSTTRCRTGAMSSPASTGRCSWCGAGKPAVAVRARRGRRRRQPVRSRHRHLDRGSLHWNARIQRFHRSLPSWCDHATSIRAALPHKKSPLRVTTATSAPAPYRSREGFIAACSLGPYRKPTG